MEIRENKEMIVRDLVRDLLDMPQDKEVLIETEEAGDRFILKDLQKTKNYVTIVICKEE